MPEPGLRTLFDVEDAHDFLTNYWPDRFFLARGPVERLGGLVDYDFEALAAMRKGYTRAFGRDPRGAETGIYVEAGQERVLYDAGFTLYFHHLAAPGVAAWAAALDAELGLVRGYTRVSAFASRRGAGLKPHYDQNDNFVCQARGAKRWRVAPNEHVRHPTLGYSIGAKPHPVHGVEAANGFPSALPEPHRRVELGPGAVMFVPRGMWHDTETVDDESLHFNVQSGLPTWRDALEYVFTRTSLLHAEELRAPILRLFDGEAPRADFEAELKEKLRGVAAALEGSRIALSREAFHAYLAARRHSSLPPAGARGARPRRRPRTEWNRACMRESQRGRPGPGASARRRSGPPRRPGRPRSTLRRWRCARRSSGSRRRSCPS